MIIRPPNDPSVNVTSNNQSAATKAGAEAATAARSESKAPSVSVTVSALARGLEKAAAAEPEVDVEKVEAMKQAIADKSYTVNASAIADKMLANAREMLQRAIS